MASSTFGVMTGVGAPSQGRAAGSRSGAAAGPASAAGAPMRADTYVATAQVSNTTKPRREDPSDGFLVGAGGRAHLPSTSLADVPPVLPKHGPSNDRTVVFVNGIMTGPEKRLESLQQLADKTGSRVVGVAARSNGLASDVAQAALEKMGRGKHPPADTVAKVVYDELQAGRRVDLQGHSRGALIISNALEQVKNRMVLEDGLSRGEAERRLAGVDVTTYARGAGSFPDGPNYTHHLNKNDPIRALLVEAGSPGRGAKTIDFDGPGGLDGHRLEAYLAAPGPAR